MASRRDLLRCLGLLGGAYLTRPGRSFGQSEQGFEPVDGNPPELALGARVPATPAPPGSSALTYDIFDNHWALAGPDADAAVRLLVLPAQASSQWIEDTMSALPRHGWRYLAADEFGYLWIAAADRLMRLDPHKPSDGWLDLSGTPELGLAGDAITAMGTGASGAVLVALRSGSVAEVDHQARTSVNLSSAPKDVDRVGADREGRTWLVAKGQAYLRPAADGAWQRSWEMVARLPGGDHDASADTLNDRFYMAGGRNGGWGYPAVPHVFGEIFELGPAASQWRIAGRLKTPRIFNGISHLDGKLWMIGGSRPDERGRPVGLRDVEIFDPATGLLSAGPDLPFAIEIAVAALIGGRIYLAGGVRAPGSHSRGAEVGKLLSLGRGETTWRLEPDCPVAMGALVGAALHNRFYIMPPDLGLFYYDTVQRRWHRVESGGQPARSPQMVAYRDELWIMGGRDLAEPGHTSIYNPGRDTWRDGPALPRDLAWGASCVLGGRLLIAGGAGGRSYNNRTFRLRNGKSSV
jgi:hypothetical protein